MHLPAFRFVAAAAREYQAKGPVYEIGSRNVNGSVRALFTELDGYHGIDVSAGVDVDVVADGATYVPPEVPHTIVCCEVLEHTDAAPRIVQQAGHVLAPGGLLLLTMAGPGRQPHSAVDGGPLRDGEFYRNIDLREVMDWASAADVYPLWLMTSADGFADVYYAGRKRA